MVLFTKSHHGSVVLQCFCQQCDYLWAENHVSTPEKKRATHYQDCVAPVLTTLLCLLVISLRSRSCSFVNLFPRCWQKSEWLHRPAQASVYVAFRAVGHTKCLFSLWSEGGGLTVNCLDIASVNKTRVLRFSFPFCPVNVDVFLFKRLVGEPWEQRWHQSRTGFPSSRSRSQLRAARWNTTGGDAVKRHMHPSFMRLIRCFGWLAAEGAFSLVHNPPLVNVMSFAVIWPSTKVLTEWSDHQSYYTSSWWSNECLYQLSWQSIQ